MDMGFMVCVMGRIRIVVFWGLTPCSLVGGRERIELSVLSPPSRYNWAQWLLHILSGSVWRFVFFLVLLLLLSASFPT